MTDSRHQGKDWLVSLLRQHHDGEPWHGPSRAALLADVTSAVAAWHPGAGAHSIWETVLHMRSWTDEVRERAQGRALNGGEPVGGDWPPLTDTSEEAWEKTKASLGIAHERLIAALGELPDRRLEERVGFSPDAPGISVRAMVRSLAEHDIYHTGQVALLKRLAKAALGIPL